MKRGFKVRATVLVLLFLVGFVLLGVRLVFLQIVDAPLLREIAQRQYHTMVQPLSLRGRILDRNGEVLATSLPAYSLALHPPWVEEEDRPRLCAFLQRLVPGWNCQELREDRPFLWVKRRMSTKEYEEYAGIVRSFYPALEWIEESRRVYPKGDLLGALLGFVGADGEGLEGLERALNEELKPLARKIPAYRDARRILLLDPQELATLDPPPPQVILTIESNLQDEVEHLLEESCKATGAKIAQAVVVELPEGAIRVAALSRRFDPNRFQEYAPEDWRFRLATDAFEPGSTVKPFLLWAALKARHPLWELVNAENGRWEIAGHTIRDDEPHGLLSLKQMVVFSSNIAAAKIGLALGKERVFETLRAFGFGERLGLNLPLEARGILRPPQRWSKLDLATISFGQGLSATLLHLARAYSRLALGGIPLNLKLVERVERGGGQEGAEPPPLPAPSPEERAITEKVLLTLKETVEMGTGKKAMIPGLEISGKTGTAQKADPRGGYAKDRYVALFAGIFPTRAPRWVVVVLLDEPKTQIYGGLVAAPLFREIAMRIALKEGLLKPEGKGKVAATKQELPGTGEDRLPTPVALAISQGVVPDLRGLPLRRAGEIAQGLGMEVEVRGRGFVFRQNPSPGTRMKPGIRLRLELKEEKGHET